MKYTLALRFVLLAKDPDRVGDRTSPRYGFEEESSRSSGSDSKKDERRSSLRTCGLCPDLINFSCDATTGCREAGRSCPGAVIGVGGKEDEESEDEPLDLMGRISCIRSTNLPCLGGPTESSEDDESGWIKIPKGARAFSGAFPLVGDDSLTETEEGETGKAESMLEDMEDRYRSAASFFGDSAFRARSISLLHTPKKSEKVRVALISLMSVGKSSCNRASIIIRRSRYRWSMVSWLGRKRVPFLVSFGICS